MCVRVNTRVLLCDGVWWCAHGIRGQLCTLPSPFMKVPGIELGSSGLCGKCLELLTRLSGLWFEMFGTLPLQTESRRSF